MRARCCMLTGGGGGRVPGEGEGEGGRRNFFDSVKGFFKREQDDAGFASVALLSGRGVQLGAFIPVMQR